MEHPRRGRGFARGKGRGPERDWAPRDAGSPNRWGGGRAQGESGARGRWHGGGGRAVPEGMPRPPPPAPPRRQERYFGVQGTNSQPPVELSPDVMNCWRKVDAAVRSESRAALIALSSELARYQQQNAGYSVWKQTWDAAADGAKGPLDSLIKALIFMPKNPVMMPAASKVLRVALQAVASVGNESRVHSSDVMLLEQCLDVVQKRLQACSVNHADSDAAAAVARQLADNLRVKSTMLLTHANSDATIATRCASLYLRINEVMEPYINHLNKAAKTSGSMDISCPQNPHDGPVWAGWRHADIGWLMEGAWLRVVPDLCQNFENAGQYAQAVHHLMVVLAFYWGAGAVWPRCRHQRQDRSVESNDGASCCGEPLLMPCQAMSRHGATMCSRSGCGRQAAWTCPRHRHNNAVCAACLVKMQTILIGNGPHASTDIYDAVVEAEFSRHDGHGYILSRVQSRKPPNIAPNWKTSYRLKCSALVAVVKLGSSGQPLTPSLQISWGEIVPVSTFNSYQKGSSSDWDWKERERGRMAVRLLCSDKSGKIRSGFDTSLDVGARVAVIDLRVFVPEVVSVLSACGNDQFLEHLEAIPFAQRLIGNGCQREATATQLGFGSDLESAVSQAIKTSEIEIVKRLSGAAQQKLQSAIQALATKANLYGTQLEAFLQALQQSIHCTQGPPGTGKSYVGVQLILALDIIRDLAAAEGHAVGPILTLSYKNHALDEILLDILKHGPGNFKRSRALVRCGNAEDVSLKPFTEQRTQAEREAQGNLNGLLETMREIDYMIARVVDMSSHIELCSLELKEASSRASSSAVSNSCMAATEFDTSSESNQSVILGQIISRWLTSAGSSSTPEQPGDHVKNVAVLGVAAVHLAANLAELLRGHDPPHEETAVLSEVISSKEATGLLRSICDLQKSAAQSSLFQSFPYELTLTGLTSSTEHWIEFQQVKGASKRTLYLFMAWLHGMAPPPRCTAVIADSGERCLMEAPAGGLSPYCERFHSCRHPSGCHQQRAEAPRNGFLCEHHKCKEIAASCTEVPMPGSMFCRRHSCPACLKAFHAGVQDVVGEACPYACETHKCQALQCHQLQLDAVVFPFCREHACVLCLQGDLQAKQAMGNTRLCVRHKCAHAVGCQRPVMREPSNTTIAVPNLIQAVDAASSSGPIMVRQNYCAAHACTACVGIKSPVDQSSKLRLCINHRCSHVRDTNERRQGQMDACQGQRISGSKYCRNHTCKVCSDKGMKMESPVMDEPPRNVCNAHRLCYRMLGGGIACDRLAVAGSYYCPAHGRARLGSPLATQGKYSCQAKTKSTSIEVASSSKTEEVHQTCHGITKKGYPCKSQGKTPAGKKYYCLAHTGQALVCSSSSSSSSSTAGESSDDEFVMSEYHDQIDNDSTDNSLRFHEGNTMAGHYIRDHNQATEQSPVDGSLDQVFANRTEHSVIQIPCPAPCQSGLQTEARTDDGSHIQTCMPPGTEAPAVHIAQMAEVVEGVSDGDIHDVDDMPEAIEVGVHPDEMMLSDADSEYESLNGNEDQERLKEVMGDEDDDVAFLKDAEKFYVGSGASSTKSTIGEVRWMMNETAAWTWEMPIAERWHAIGRMLRKASTLLTEMRHTSEHEIDLARQCLSAASAIALKQARVIGATVVGAARRLEALRAAEPFAVVVEEACEVMEPMLMAVLATGSLRKLELVGDHYQLPAFVQNCWFTIESAYPSIKISLFERLIMSSQHNRSSSSTKQVRRRREEEECGANDCEYWSGVACSILDEQRRMRTAIADLTRGEYAELVTIQDHQCTATRRVGDSLTADSYIKRELQVRRSQWLGQGMLAPGVLPQQFFWNISGNKEGKPRSGLSACNYVEAAAASQLAAWFARCGVPPSAISILTPLKGQKMAIIQELRSIDKHLAADVIISTVDRYQGDENDIIILSLVRTRPGNRFVALRNRFIVAASRARIGFYILGSTDAVAGIRDGQPSGPAHWRRLLDKLKEPIQKVTTPPCTATPEEAAGNDVIIHELSETGNSKPFQSCGDKMDSASENEVMNTDRNEIEVVKAFELTAPAGDTNSNAVSTGDSPSDGQKQQRTGHHVSQHQDGTEDLYGGPRLGNYLPICCPHHPNTFRRVVQANDFPQASNWNAFCKEECPHLLSWCRHQCQEQCHAMKPADHTPSKSCRHLLTRPCSKHGHIPLACGELYLASCPQLGARTMMPTTFSSALAEHKCQEIVEYHRPECTHSENIPCYVHQNIAAGVEKLPACSAKVDDFIHPACGHRKKSPKCVEWRTWVAEPPTCNEKVKYTNPGCNHSTTMECWRSVQEATAPSPCKRPVEVPRPRCGHALSVRCSDAKSLREAHGLNGSVKATYIDNKTCLLVEHGFDYGPSESVLASNIGLSQKVPRCSLPVRLRLPCGHIVANIQCGKAFDLAALEAATINIKCQSETRTECPLCRNIITVPCWARSSSAWETIKSHVPALAMSADSSAAFFYIRQSALAALPRDDLMSELVAILLSSCTGTIQVEQTCGHSRAFPCSSILRFVANGKAFPACRASVERPLECGHSATIICCTRDHQPPPLCQQAVADMFTYPCGKHSVPAQTCSRLRELQALEQPLCPEVVTCKRYRCGHDVLVPCHLSGTAAASRPGQRMINNLVEAGVPYADDAPELEPCQLPVTFRHSGCHHQLNNIKCSQAFSWAIEEPPCTKQVGVPSPFCSHELSLPCWEADRLSQWEPWGPNSQSLETVTDALDHGNSPIVSPVVSNATPRPLPMLLGLRSDILHCGKNCLVVHECGHSMKVPCAEALAALDKPCKEIVTTECTACGCVSSLTCDAKQKQISSGCPSRCKNKVSKICTACKINETLAECFRQDVRCQKDVTATLPCGHELTWTCGEDDDPRRLGTEFCLQCVISKWDRALNEGPHPVPSAEILLEHVMSALPDGTDIVSITKAPDPPLQAMEQVWFDIMQRTRDWLVDCHAGGEGLEEAHIPPMLGDLANYDVIFKHQLDPQSAIEFSPAGSSYGSGVLARILTTHGLQRLCQPDDEGLVSIRIGVAFRYKAVRDMPQFTKSIGSQKKANQMVSQLQTQGFDHAVPIDSTVDLPTRVYWAPGAAVALASVVLRLHCLCTICFEHKLRSEGCMCCGEHFTCWECFEILLETAKSPDATLRQVDGAGNLCCPTHGCEAVYHIHEVARQASHGQQQDIIAGLVELRSAARINDVLPQALSAERERLTAEFQRIQAIADLDERAAAILRMEIVEEILTLKCPACKTAFHDFDGCWALTCSRCHAGICAWCLAHCGTDAHMHVAACPESRVDGYSGGGMDAFHEHHRLRKGRLITNRLRREGKPEIRNATLRLLTSDLRLPNGRVIEVGNV